MNTRKVDGNAEHDIENDIEGIYSIQIIDFIRVLDCFYSFILHTFDFVQK